MALGLRKLALLLQAMGQLHDIAMVVRVGSKCRVVEFGSLLPLLGITGLISLFNDALKPEIQS